MSKRRDHLVSRQPINWAFIDLVSPLPWQTNHFDVNLPFVYAGARRELIGAQPQFYTGQVRPRETEIDPYMYPQRGDHVDQRQRPDSPPPGPPPPQPTIPINLEGTMSGPSGGPGDHRNPRIRHPPYQNTRDGSTFYAGSSLPQHIHMPLSGQQAQRPTYGAAREA